MSISNPGRAGHERGPWYEDIMGRTTTVVFGVLVMVALIVAVDVLLLRDHFWLRLIVNVGIVAVFAGVYLKFQKRV